VSATDALAARLEALPFAVEAIDVRWTPVELPSYPDGPRPSSIVTLTGARHRGRGEHVGWTREAHERFAAAAATLPRGRLLLRDWVTAIAPFAPYDRAALEAAGIDLALRQHETTLFGLAGVAPRPLRWVVSFAAVFDPVTEAARHPGCELKIDVDPRWSDEVLGRLRALGRVAVLDWKMQGAPAEHERAHRHLPNAWIEDPRPGDTAWSPSLRARIVADAPVVSVDALAALPLRPAAVNVKPARMGGVLAALDCLAHCAGQGIATYIGGMFEVGVGRKQLQVLAALACADGPNDVAPLRGPARSGRLVPPDQAGFG
jgi:L-alanine-DL-glutamate epimerase-like enolase superfamily enzyme